MNASHSGTHWTYRNKLT